MDDAKAAGLLGKQGPWTQYPKRMRQMRARAFAVRDVFPDVLKGLQIDAPAEAEAPKEEPGYLKKAFQAAIGRKKSSGSLITVDGMSDVLVRFAKCCNPIPGDAIVGYITRGHGVSVHRADCPNVLANKEDADRMIEVSWNVATDVTYKVVLRLTCMDQTGVMANIMTVTSETKVNINSLNAHTDANRTAYVDMGLDITSLEQLNYVIGRLRRIKGVIRVERKISGV